MQGVGRQLRRFVTVTRLNMSKKAKLDAKQMVVTSSINTEAGGVPRSVTASPDTHKRKVSKLSGLKYLQSPDKPPNDKKTYTVIQLPNGLKATLVSDPTPIEEAASDVEEEEEEEECESSDGEGGSVSGKSDASDEESGGGEKLAACSLTVEVGSFSDPVEIQGLAHFLEHMVFMGSAKYPKENEFDSFIKKYSGSDNASTECEYTTFYFECQEKHLRKALDIFSQFFIAPLMKRDAMTREREAIESEFQLAVPWDPYRKEQILCSLANSDNPARKFTWGNQVTLRDRVNDDFLYESVHKFWATHYSADRMNLAIQARLPTEQLEEWVFECFSEVPKLSKPESHVKTLDEPFNMNEFHKLYHVQSVRDAVVMELTWILPPDTEHYKSKPVEYLSHIIGDEGKGSLTSYLRKHTLALGLASGHSEDGLSSNRLYSMFQITVELTDKGKDDYNRVLTAIFSYLKMLQTQGPNEELFKELQLLTEMNFRYAEETSAVTNVENLSEDMVFYPPQHYLTGSDLFFEYNPQLIQSYLELLVPETVNITIALKKMDPEVNLDRVEPWFQTKFASTEIPAEWFDSWKSVDPYPDFHLPEKNPFITTDFTLVTDSSVEVPKHPQLVKRDSLMEVYYKADQKFKLPYGSINIHLVTQSLKNSPLDTVLLSLFYRMVSHHLIEELYPARTALLDFFINATEHGLEIKLYGFNQHLGLLAEKLAQGMAEFSQTAREDLLDALKRKQLRFYYNDVLSPQMLAKKLRKKILIDRYFIDSQKYSQVPLVNIENLNEFARKFPENVFMYALVQGNFTSFQAIDICQSFAEKARFRPIPTDSIRQFSVVQLPPQQENCIRVKSLNPNDKTSATTFYYQLGPGTIETFVTLQLLNMIMEEPLFDQLRTQEQLGYDVSCTERETYGILGLTVSVHSQIDKFTLDDIESRINQFLDKFLKTFETGSSDEFDNAKQSLIKIKSCVDNHLKDEVKRNWHEVRHMEFIFDRLDKEIKLLSALKREQVLQMLTDLISDSTKRKLIVQVEGHASESNESSSVVGTDECDLPPEILLNYLGDSNSVRGPEFFIRDIEKFKDQLQLYPPCKLVD